MVGVENLKLNTKRVFVANTFNPFRVTRRDSRRQNKVKVKGLGRNSSYLAGFFIIFSSVKKFSQLAKKKLCKIFL